MLDLQSGEYVFEGVDAGNIVNTFRTPVLFVEEHGRLQSCEFLKDVCFGLRRTVKEHGRVATEKRRSN